MAEILLAVTLHFNYNGEIVGDIEKADS
jgi:hypothetical protein